MQTKKHGKSNNHVLGFIVTNHFVTRNTVSLAGPFIAAERDMVGTVQRFGGFLALPLKPL